MMKRRRFLQVGAGSLAAYLGFHWLTTSEEEMIGMIVQTKLHYLTLDADGVSRFARDLVTLKVISGSRLSALSTIGPLYKHTRLSAGQNKLSHLLRHGEDRIVSTYLISSDFFINGADEARVIRYLGSIGQNRPCANPFARPVMS